MTYDDMPVGTVLRCTDGEFLGTIVARDEYGWTSAGEDGRCLPSDFGNDWVELVEKPAAPEHRPNLRDASGDVWTAHESGFYQFQKALWPREEIEQFYGPCTEVTS